MWAYSTGSPNYPKLTLLIPLGVMPEKPPLDMATIIACLPTHPQALRLFDHYVDSVNWMCHIIHVPTVRTELQSLYHDLAMGKSTDLVKLARLATLLGS